MTMDKYWKQYDEVKALIVSDKPQTFAELKIILDAFQTPSAGDAFWPGGDGTYLSDELRYAGWRVTEWHEDFHYVIVSPTDETVEYVEGDLYLRRSHDKKPQN